MANYGASHLDRQRDFSDSAYAAGPRAHVVDDSPLVSYIVRSPLAALIAHLREVDSRIELTTSFLVLCAGEGLEGTVLADLGFVDVTVSDLSTKGVAAALRRDQRLKGLVLNALATGLPDNSYDVVLVQTALHHLHEPVAGLTEMLRLCRIAVGFLEPHDSFAGRHLGLEWEVNGEATNYVFRWKSHLVQQVVSSYFGQPGCFTNSSYSFWHHNTHLHSLGKRLGGGTLALRSIRFLKRAGDAIAARQANQFCGIVSITPDGQRAKGI
jgi:SAM-dependent methyltransferase